jgi:hypothetical protein
MELPLIGDQPNLLREINFYRGPFMEGVDEIIPSPIALSKMGDAERESAILRGRAVIESLRRGWPTPEMWAKQEGVEALPESVRKELRDAPVTPSVTLIESGASQEEDVTQDEEDSVTRKRRLTAERTKRWREKRGK